METSMHARHHRVLHRVLSIHGQEWLERACSDQSLQKGPESGVTDRTRLTKDKSLFLDELIALTILLDQHKREKPKDWRRREGLCLYCGEKDHSLATKSVVPKDATTHTQFCLPDSIMVTNSPFPVSVLVDSGSAGNFFAKALVTSLSIPVESLPAPIPIKALDGRLVSVQAVKQITKLLHLAVAENHKGKIQFLVLG